MVWPEIILFNVKVIFKRLLNLVRFVSKITFSINSGQDNFACIKVLPEFKNTNFDKLVVLVTGLIII